MTESSPGPWRIDRKAKNETSFSVRGSDNWAICACRAVAPDGTRYHPYIALANARLIAAAPDMLTALENAASALEYAAANLHSDPFQSKIQITAQAIRTAIVKARGTTATSSYLNRPLWTVE